MNQVDKTYGVVQALAMADHARLVADAVTRLTELGFIVRAFGGNPGHQFVFVDYGPLCDAAHARGEAVWYRIERAPQGPLYTFRWPFAGVAVEWQRINPELH